MHRFHKYITIDFNTTIWFSTILNNCKIFIKIYIKFNIYVKKLSKN